MKSKLINNKKGLAGLTITVVVLVAILGVLGITGGIVTAFKINNFIKSVPIAAWIGLGFLMVFLLLPKKRK